MDEPRRSAAQTSKWLIPIALGVLLLAYVLPVEETNGGTTVTYSRLLGFRVEGQDLDPRLVAGNVVLHLTWLVVALLALRRTTAKERGVVFGAAAILGIGEVLYLIARLVYDQLVGMNAYLSGLGGILLIVGAVVGMGYVERPEIHESEGARA